MDSQALRQVALHTLDTAARNAALTALDTLGWPPSGQGADAFAAMRSLLITHPVDVYSEARKEVLQQVLTFLSVIQ